MGEKRGDIKADGTFAAGHSEKARNVINPHSAHKALVIPRRHPLNFFCGIKRKKLLKLGFVARIRKRIRLYVFVIAAVLAVLLALFGHFSAIGTPFGLIVPRSEGFLFAVRRKLNISYIHFLRLPFIALRMLFLAGAVPRFLPAVPVMRRAALRTNHYV